MLRIKLEVKQDRPKELSPTEYEFTQGVVKSEDLRGKKLYYTVENVFKTNTLPGSFRLYRVSKKKLIPFIFKSAASLQEFDRSPSWVYEAYQISEPLIILKHKSYSLWD